MKRLGKWLVPRVTRAFVNRLLKWLVPWPYRLAYRISYRVFRIARRRVAKRREQTT